MNTLKTTMSKIAEIQQQERIDLGLHEVELASGFLAVLEDKTKKLELVQDELSKITTSFLDIRKKGTIKYKEAQNSVKELTAVIQQVNEMSNQLGLNAKNIQELGKAVKILDTYNRFTEKESKQYFS